VFCGFLVSETLDSTPRLYHNRSRPHLRKFFYIQFRISILFCASAIKKKSVKGKISYMSPGHSSWPGYNRELLLGRRRPPTKKDI